MSKIAGITIERKITGKNFNLVINYRKHPELVENILEQFGINNPANDYDPKFVKKILSQKGETGIAIKTEDLWK